MSAQPTRLRPALPKLDARFATGHDSRLGIYAGAATAVALTGSALTINRSAMDAISVPKLHLILIAAGVGAGAWLWWRSSSCEAGLPRGLAPRVLALATVAALATCFSRIPRLSIWGLPLRYGGLLPLLAYLSLAVTAAWCALQWRRTAQGACAAIVLAAVVMALYVVAQRAGLDWINWTNPETHQAADWATGTMGNSNFAGGYLGIAIPMLACALAGTTRRRGRAGLGALLGLTACALWFTQARGGMLAAFAGCGVLIGAARQSFPKWCRRVAAAVAILIAVGGFVTVFHPGMAKAPGPLAGVRTSTLTNRVEFWGGALKIAVAHPLLGTGPDTFYREYLQIRPVSEARRNGLSIPDKPHSVPLEYASNLGIVGFLAWLALVTHGVALACRRVRDGDGRPNFVLLACLGGFAAYLAQSLVSIDQPPLAVTGWVLLGSLYGLAGLAKAPVAEARSTRFARSWALKAIALGIAMAGVVAGTRLLQASVEAYKGNDDRASELQPYDSSFASRLGDKQRVQALAAGEPGSGDIWLRRADASYRAALSRQPDSLILVFRLAQLNLAWAEGGEPSRVGVAKHWWDEARRVDPHDPAIHARYADASQRLRGRALELQRVAAAGGGAAAWADSAEAFVGIGDTASARTSADAALALDARDQRSLALLRKLDSATIGRASR